MSEARIYDQGYRRYEGARLGPRSAVFSVWRQTVQRILGLRRSARHKVLPILAIAIAYLPAIAFIGILALIPAGRGGDVRAGIPTYSQYFFFTNAAILLVSVFSAPEALCPDRRNRSLSLYLASPLTRESYLVAKALAVFTVLCIVTIGPLLLLLIGYVLQNHGPDGPFQVLITLLRIIGAGAAVSAFATAFSLAVSSLTDRRGLATGAALIALMTTHAAAGVLAFGLRLSRTAGLLSLLIAPFELASRILKAPAGGLALAGVPTVTVAAAVGAWTLACGLLVWARYAALRVTR